MNRKVLTAACIGLVAIVLGACMTAGNEVHAPIDNDDQYIKQLVQEYSVGNRKAQAASASITSSQLIVTGKDDQKVVYSLPENEFFVSIAPYIAHTHECAIHSLTGCQGELTNEQFSVHIEDKKGNVVIDQTLKSQSNGFIDLWLPRDNTYRISISHDGKTAVSDISTFDGDNTCITTIQLTEPASA